LAWQSPLDKYYPRTGKVPDFLSVFPWLLSLGISSGHLTLRPVTSVCSSSATKCALPGLFTLHSPLAVEASSERPMVPTAHRVRRLISGLDASLGF